MRTAVALRLLDLWVMAHQPMTEAVRRELAAIGDEREGPDPDEWPGTDDAAYWDAQDALRDELEGVA